MPQPVMYAIIVYATVEASYEPEFKTQKENDKTY